MGAIEFDYRDDAVLRPFDLAVDGLTENEAYALAELCKRIGWADCRSLAVSDDETRHMIRATDKVRAGLAKLGVVVR